MARAGRTILPARTSGHNPPPTPVSAALSPAHAPVRTAGPGNAPDPATRARQASGVTLVAPTVRGAAITLRIGGHSHNLPSGVALAFGRAYGRDLVYVMGAGRRIWILTATAEGIRELAGCPLNMLAEIRTAHFA